MASSRTRPCPRSTGFQTIERIGAGGMGDVFKLRDLTLDRIVAAKVPAVRSVWTPRINQFLSEAQALALFTDRRIVQISRLPRRARPRRHHHGVYRRLRTWTARAIARVRAAREDSSWICDAFHHAHSSGYSIVT